MSRLRWRSAAITMIAPLLLVLSGVAAADETTTAETLTPQLSINIDNGQTSTDAGASLTYAITLQNLGSEDLADLVISQSLPAELVFQSADSDGKATVAGITWTVDVPANGTVELHSTMTVGAPPAELLRLATVACAAIEPDGPPIVCATHSDELPAGAAAAEAAAVVAGEQADPIAGNSAIWWYGGGAVVLLAMLIILLARWKRRKV